ncbi:ATP-dependent 6-phosphofructokinase [Candidatus Desulfarcum epimagneticum]|uniref:ATP-dependent 6-phosphofructokinase n=1 Tax=uncultured Desulfobacteraceae bacterium TaxID=218296 RepID=A0A484HJY1_9BACT|nr:ATP-dependent 6-phosphofructokinase [uncultured Desulfobacteraceae bacterium]
MNLHDTAIARLGEPSIPSPIRHAGLVSDRDRVVIETDHARLSALAGQGKDLPSFEKAGPGKTIYFDPGKLKCAIVTCGGLCPGLNDIIRAIVLELWHGYGVRNILGARHGLQGFVPAYGHDFVELTPESVDGIQNRGGSVLGSSRGPQDMDEIVSALDRANIGALFMIGGDGSLKAADKIAETLAQRGLKIAVVGVPKTIDNDICMTSRSFGFDTAVEIATQAVKAAHNEATGYPGGIGLIKLMGRHSGFIAATAAIAQQDVNFVLIPEVDFDLEGPGGLLDALSRRLERRGHAVIVAAEGAGRKFFDPAPKSFDASGNERLQDIGLFLKEAISRHFAEKSAEISIKYIDPSYMIRSLPANANDSAFCGLLGRDAAHAAMAGKTRLMIGALNDEFAHIPIRMAVGKRKQVDPAGKLWIGALESTGQGQLKRAGV